MYDAIKWNDCQYLIGQSMQKVTIQKPYISRNHAILSFNWIILIPEIVYLDTED